MKNKTAKDIINTYVQFFVSRSHKRIANSPLVPENDPTTLFTSAGMQPLIPYLMGEPHPAGNKLVNVQNCFRAVDIEEVGDNRHTTFFRMLGNWSLGDYFKKEEIPWLWELLTKEFCLPKEKLFITVFNGYNNIEKDGEAYQIWEEILKADGFDPETKIFFDDSNWWSRSGAPKNMPVGEIGGPDTEVYYRFDELDHKPECKDNPVDCKCGKFLEIANSVFMQYKKTEDSFKPLPKANVDFGGGVERILAAVENIPDIFQTDLFTPIINGVENESGKAYKDYKKEMQVIADHLTAAVFITASGIRPSKTDQGYILRRLIRRALDNFRILEGENISFVLEKITEQYSQTDEILKEKYEEIKNVILEEEQNYQRTIKKAEKIISFSASPSPSPSEEDNGVQEISAEEAFKMYTTHGLSPAQIKSLGFIFDEQKFANKMEEHQKLSRSGAEQKFKGGLADHSELTIMGHTATHLLHKALRDMFGIELHQTGSNITNERVRFDFNFDRMLTAEEIKDIENTVNIKIEENLPVHFEILPIEKAKQTGAIGLFDEKYANDVKVYFVGPSTSSGQAYSVELCGGPHVDFTGELKKFKIIKVENIGKGQKRIYAKINKQLLMNKIEL
jgi:alanyl-tRNA synthetase